MKQKLQIMLLLLVFFLRNALVTVDNLVITWQQFVTVLSGIRVSFVITSLTKAFNAFGNLPVNAFFSFYRLCTCSQLGPTRCQDGCNNQIFFYKSWPFFFWSITMKSQMLWKSRCNGGPMFKVVLELLTS